MRGRFVAAAAAAAAAAGAVAAAAAAETEMLAAEEADEAGAEAAAAAAASAFATGRLRCGSGSVVGPVSILAGVVLTLFFISVAAAAAAAAAAETDVAAAKEAEEAAAAAEEAAFPTGRLRCGSGSVGAPTCSLAGVLVRTLFFISVNLSSAERGGGGSGGGGSGGGSTGGSAGMGSSGIPLRVCGVWGRARPVVCIGEDGGAEDVNRRRTSRAPFHLPPGGGVLRGYSKGCFGGYFIRGRVLAVCSE